MTVKFTKFDPVDYLDSPDRIKDYLAVAKEENDPALYKEACETAKRARKKLHQAENLSLKVKFESTSIHSIHSGFTMYSHECYGVA